MTDPAVPRESAASPDREQGPYSRAYTNYVLVVAFGVMIFHNVDRTILSILVDSIKAEFELSDTAMGAAMGLAFTIVYAGLSLPIARWADFSVRRSIVAGGLFLWSFFTAATGAVQSFTQLFLLRMGVGAGEAAGVAPTASLLSDYVPPSRRARSLSVLSTGAVTGMGLGMVIGGWINEAYGWRWAFVAVGVPGMLLALVLRLTVREPQRGASERPTTRVDAAPDRDSVRDALRYLWSVRSYRYIVLANAFSLFAIMGRNLWQPAFVMRIYDMGSFSAGIWYYAMSPLPSALGIYLGGRLADRLASRRDPRWYLWVPALGQAVSVPILLAFILWPEGDRFAMPAAIAAVGVPEIPVAFVISFVGSIFASFFTAPLVATTQGVARLRMRALAAAISNTVSTFVGMCAGPLLVGMMSDSFEVRFGHEALRYALLVPTAVPLLSALTCVIGAGSVGRDLEKARE